MNSQPLDLIPSWCFFPLIMAIGVLTVEGGYRFGKWRHSQVADEKVAPVAAMVAAIFALLAFMLAFTFSLAATRFDARRQIVLEEANAISTTYLRSRLLPNPERSECAKLLFEYTQLRVEYVKQGRIAELLEQSEKLHEQLWSQAVSAAQKDPSSLMTGLFLKSLNETIDLHSKRVFVSLQSRIPPVIWGALFSLTLLSMASVGYHAGLSATRRSPEMPVLTLAFAGVLILIIDLDRGHEGLLRVSQQPLIDALKTMQAAQQ